MDLKYILGAALGITLGTFATPATALKTTVPPNRQPPREMRMLLAEASHPDLEDKAEEKAAEVKNATRSASNAIKRVHRRHEASEHRNVTLGAKVGSKIDEAGDEAKGASNAIENEHARHEQLEHSQGRD